MKKKRLALGVTVVLFAALLVALGVYASAAEARAASPLTYTFENGEATVKSCRKDASGRVVIPEVLGNGTPVTAIGVRAFANCFDVTEVVIPDTVKSIDFDAFCFAGIRTLVLPASIESVSDTSFAWCENLESLTVSEGIKAICGFRGCIALESVQLPDSLVSIDASAFEGCSSLSSITLPQGGALTRIADYAFRDTALTEIDVPEGVTVIGQEAFEDCTALAEIRLPQSLRQLGIWAFSGTAYYEDPTHRTNGALYIDSTLIDVLTTASGAFTVREGTKGIAAAAFRGCDRLTEVILPDDLTYIGGYTFDGCVSLTALTVPKRVTFIGIRAFAGSGLVSIDLSQMLGDLEESLFADCTSLTTVRLPDGLSEIPFGMFNGCTSLCEIDLPNGLTRIRELAFDGTRVLEGAQNDGGALYLNRYLLGTDGSLSGEYTVREDTRCIADGALEGALGLTALVLPRHLTEVPEALVRNCSALKSVTLSPSTTRIGESAFSGCSALESLDIPVTLTSIGSFAFGDCSSLKSVRYAGTLADWQRISYSGYQSDLAYIVGGITFLSFERGDVNCDTRIDERDVLALRGHIVRAAPLDEALFLQADINGDGTVNSRDVVLLLRGLK